MEPRSPALLTLGAIAKEIGEPLHRVKYAVSSYSIEHTQRAGIIRLFDREMIPTIRAAVKRIANRREVGNAGF